MRAVERSDVAAESARPSAVAGSPSSLRPGTRLKPPLFHPPSGPLMSFHNGLHPKS